MHGHMQCACMKIQNLRAWKYEIYMHENIKFTCMKMTFICMKSDISMQENMKFTCMKYEISIHENDIFMKIYFHAWYLNYPCMKMKFYTWKWHSMHENDILMHENDISMHENGNFAPSLVNASVKGPSEARVIGRSPYAVLASPREGHERDSLACRITRDSPLFVPVRFSALIDPLNLTFRPTWPQFYRSVFPATLDRISQVCEKCKIRVQRLLARLIRFLARYVLQDFWTWLKVCGDGIRHSGAV